MKLQVTELKIVDTLLGVSCKVGVARVADDSVLALIAMCLQDDVNEAFQTCLNTCIILPIPIRRPPGGLK